MSNAPSRVALISGGMDSAVLLWSLKPDVKALMFDYGQRHVKELAHAQRLCRLAEVEYDIADLQGITHLISKGSQSGREAVPDGHYAEMTMKTTIVPNRNSIMLAIAVGHAVAIGADQVYFAAHGGDHTIYPDCRPGFVDAFSDAMELANEWTPVCVWAPFTSKSKSDLVTLGIQLAVPFEHTWSCYKGGDIHCGTCGTCVERREAFALAGVTDPTTYA